MRVELRETGELAFDAADAAVVDASVLGQILSRGRFRAGLALLGPAFVAAVAYVDPGNFATNFQAGGKHGYTLVWVNVMASVMAMLVQYGSSKLGLATGQSLPELCRKVFPRRANMLLWVQAEGVAMATDLAEFTGAALGLNLVFGIPLFPAGLITAVVAFGVLGLEQRGFRRFELAVMALLALVALGFIYAFFAVGHQSFGSLGHGFIPRLGGSDSAALAVGIIGATVMPHVVYLHSALQKNRIKPVNSAERRQLLHFNRIDCIVGLGIAGVVNVVMLCVAAALARRSGVFGLDDLTSVHHELAVVVGGGAALAFGVALIASGLSSSSVGTYSGQIVMSGFMRWRIPLVLRRLLTMIPSLVVLALVSNATGALVLSQIALSFGIPFALIPLALFTSRRDLMGDLVNTRLTTVTMWVVTAVITGLNLYLIEQAIF